MKKRLEHFKKYLCISAFLIFVVLFIINDNIYTQKAINECIKNGQKENICKELER